uniref:Arrestin domain containing 2 n=1 Tax=Hucho hucho TaxID=62062 RepID=A0A4W5LE61_9TELE
MTFKTIKRFKLELDEPDDAVYASGEIVSGQVVLELNRETKVHSMKVIGRGVAAAHWVEDHSVGMNAVYNDYTSKITYFRKRQHLIRGRWWLVHSRSLRCGRFLRPLWTSRGAPGVCCLSHHGLEASGEGPSVSRRVGGVRSGGEMLGTGGGRVGPFDAAGVPPSPSGLPCASSSGSSPRSVSVRCWSRA